MKELELIKGSCIYYPIGDNLPSNLSIIKKMAEAIELVQVEYYPDTKRINLVGQGSSGAIIAGIVATTIMERTELNVSVIHLRKDGERTHRAGNVPSFTFDSAMVVVIDDMIDTGTTISNITKRLMERRHAYDGKIDVLCVTGGVHQLRKEVRDCYRFAIISQNYHSGEKDD